MRKMSTAFKICLGASLYAFGAQVALSQGLQNSIALTVAPGQCVCCVCGIVIWMLTVTGQSLGRSS